MSIFTKWCGIDKCIQEQSNRTSLLEARIAYLEDRLLSYYKNRWDVVDKLADYLVGTQLQGDYLEFGVFEGKTFSYAFKIMAQLFPEMKFVALDSFEGLPEPKGIDANDSYTSGFYKGQFACSGEQFESNLRARGVDMSRVSTIKGWFDSSLSPGSQASDTVSKVAAAWIDCDLYESTVPVLNFLTDRLSVGAVLLFDDWRCYRNLPEFGQQRACKEWLARNPQIKLNEFVDFGFHGQAFTVASC
ncbi:MULTISPECIES: TylF/MycF/NovP-related O-methyltransferase [Polaromonas]|uniref:TylF/MycF/NovP-related O-methyltransferase n=1 Tax=Polaromonas aquatica TaxID=332657 RepID=A0ABW1U2K0_9BURK